MIIKIRSAKITKRTTPTTLPDPLSDLSELIGLPLLRWHAAIGCSKPSQIASKTPSEGTKFPY